MMRFALPGESSLPPTSVGAMQTSAATAKLTAATRNPGARWCVGAMEAAGSSRGPASVLGVERKQLALIAAIMGSFVAGLDATVVNVALPSIRADLGGGLAGQQWVSNAYLLTLGSLILVAGSLGDLYGERRIFSIGVGGFGAVSVLCALAPSIGGLRGGPPLPGGLGAPPAP